LLDIGADVEAKDNDGLTALYMIASQGLSSMVEVLLDKGAKIETKDKWG
jgi:ankyrin repeat protein